VNNIKAGDRVKIKDRKDWPSPPGYPLAKSQGNVISVREEEGFVAVHLMKTGVAPLKDTILTFRLENIEKV
jgi:hypothetical protein